MKRPSPLAFVSATAACADDRGFPGYGVKIPAGCRHGEVVAPSRKAGNLDELDKLLASPPKQDKLLELRDVNRAMVELTEEQRRRSDRPRWMDL